MSDREPIQYLPDYVMEFGKHDLDDVLQMARMFSHVIDFRSRFTATHSAGVAHTAGKLAELSGMSADEHKMMLIAGYLHDLGKLAVKNSILEKPSKLSINEFDVIRSHSFYTYKLLSGIEGFHTINQWASFHHEKLNGAGYPFHLKGEQIPFGSRVMTVADIFTAVIEHRPYRNGVDKQQVRGIFEKLVKNGEVCEAAVDTLVGNLDVFVELCNREQQLAAEDYESFFSDEETAVLV
jgi:HD-GYP domain-containing protein (c-di-GMP phosphodiesterase class II)